MNTHDSSVDRRHFLKSAAAFALSGAALQASQQSKPEPKRTIKVGVIGCGSVSEKYFPDLKRQPFVEIVSACDIRVRRARAKAEQFGVPHVFDEIEKMLAGPDFELLVNLTSMPAHYAVNKRGLQAGKNVWSEKPPAMTVEQVRELIALAKQKGVGFWSAPAMVLSPKFRFMAKVLAENKLGRVCAVHAVYGHNGHRWLWAPEFFQTGGGCLYDLGVYNIITLTGLLGPVKRVAGMWNIVHPQVTVTTHEGEQQTVNVETDENAMLIMEHESGALTHVQTGFCYFDAMKPHDAVKDELHSIEIIGDQGVMKLAGYDWGPIAVDLATQDHPETQRFCTEEEGFRWQMGASYIAECLSSGQRPLMTAEHALHALEIMNACRTSGSSGRHIKIQSRFPWPII